MQWSHCHMMLIVHSVSARAWRITGSTCGKILCQKDRTDALLMCVMYSKPMNVLPPPIKWGFENEKKACAEYVRFMRTNESRPCGFLIHEITHRSIFWCFCEWSLQYFNLCQGIMEFKCPYSNRDEDPLIACDHPNFYCSHFHLKKLTPATIKFSCSYS